MPLLLTACELVRSALHRLGNQNEMRGTIGCHSEATTHLCGGIQVTRLKDIG